IVANHDVVEDTLTSSRMWVAMSYFHPHSLDALIDQLETVSTSCKWHARRAAIEFVQNLVFSNLFNSRPYAKRLNSLVLKYLFNEQLEVRTIASLTLSGFYQCGYIELTREDLIG
ncbi:unnamed protein product, partial [Rotaria magnacalcarata]